jgi:hypothetical protein
VEVTPRRVAFVLERTNTVAFELYCWEKVDVYDWSLEVERRSSERWADRATERPERC